MNRYKKPRILLELMIPPHYRLGCTVVVRPSRIRVVPGSNPGLAILFSAYKYIVHTRAVQSNHLSFSELLRAAHAPRQKYTPCTRKPLVPRSSFIRPELMTCCERYEAGRYLTNNIALHRALEASIPVNSV
jgi:hypothetical protein